MKFSSDPLADKARRKLDNYFEGRDSLSPADFYSRYFSTDGFEQEAVTKIRKIFENQLGYDFSRIHDTDDFSKELAIVWDIDSLADVEIVLALEEAFHIKISESEAASMNTLRRVIEIIHEKTVS